MVLSHGTGVRIPVPVPSFARGTDAERATDGEPSFARDHAKGSWQDPASSRHQTREGCPPKLAVNGGERRWTARTARSLHPDHRRITPERRFAARQPRFAHFRFLNQITPEISRHSERASCLLRAGHGQAFRVRHEESRESSEVLHWRHVGSDKTTCRAQCRNLHAHG